MINLVQTPIGQQAKIAFEDRGNIEEILSLRIEEILSLRMET